MNKKNKNLKLNWSEKYFFIDKKGNLNINIKNKKKKIKIKKIITNEIKKKLPVKFCIPEIIKDKTNKINKKFNYYINKYNYKGKYFLIYPIKVNQKSYVIQTILKNKKYKIGLESGSKTELITILINSNKKITILCNGYKDKIYMYIAYLATKIGHKIYIIIEKIKELKLLWKYIKKKNFFIGIRIKLNNLEINPKKNKSQFKFGLTSNEILKIIKILIKKKTTNNLKILHCHLESQIKNIKNIIIYIKEIINLYIDIQKIFKIKIKIIDIGGGLALQYSNNKNINYDINKYIKYIIKIIKKICNKNKIKHPNLITESGRYITAHHEFIITNIYNIEKNKKIKIKKIFIKKKNKILNNIWKIWINIKKKKYISNFFIKKNLKKIKNEFKIGKYNIIEKSWIENIYKEILKKIYKYKIFKKKNILKNINLYISKKIHLNFSIFQSIPDSWGTNQIFPILPIIKLKKKKNQKINILDITCDSDGKINNYINIKNYISNSLEIPYLKNYKSVFIGIFMTGAYQNILSNKHNLFGNLQTYLIKIKKNNKYEKKIINLNESIINVTKKTNIKNNQIKKFLNKYKKNNKIIKKIKKIFLSKTYLK